MLFAVHPLALVFATVRPTCHAKIYQLWYEERVSVDYLPVESAMAFLLVVNIVALIFTTIWPLEDAGAFHFVVAPHTLVLTTIRPVVDTYNIWQMCYTPCLIINDLVE